MKRKQPIVASFYPKEGRMTVREREGGKEAVKIQKQILPLTTPEKFGCLIVYWIKLNEVMKSKWNISQFHQSTNAFY